jgi:hypothetical protein
MCFFLAHRKKKSQGERANEKKKIKKKNYFLKIKFKNF